MTAAQVMTARLPECAGGGRVEPADGGTLLRMTESGFRDRGGDEATAAAAVRRRGRPGSRVRSNARVDKRSGRHRSAKI
jgi:hypothetical protein